MTNQLSKLKCKTCEGLEDKLSEQKVSEYLSKLQDWKLKDNKIQKEFKFKDFQASLIFINQVGQLAEDECHHPDIEFGWGYAKIILTTHAVKGLSINDFILAAKIDQISI